MIFHRIVEWLEEVSHDIVTANRTKSCSNCKCYFKIFNNKDIDRGIGYCRIKKIKQIVRHDHVCLRWTKIKEHENE